MTRETWRTAASQGAVFERQLPVQSSKSSNARPSLLQGAERDPCRMCARSLDLVCITRTATPARLLDDDRVARLQLARLDCTPSSAIVDAVFWTTPRSSAMAGRTSALCAAALLIQVHSLRPPRPYAVLVLGIRQQRQNFVYFAHCSGLTEQRRPQHISMHDHALQSQKRFDLPAAGHLIMPAASHAWCLHRAAGSASWWRFARSKLLI